MTLFLPTINRNMELLEMLYEYRRTLEKTAPEKTVFSVQRMIHEWWSKDFNKPTYFTGILKVFDCLGSAYVVQECYTDPENFYKAKVVLYMLDMVILLLETNALLLETDFDQKAKFYWNPEK